MDDEHREGGSSPLTRGAQTKSPVKQSCRGLIPAYAGSTRRQAAALTKFSAHPRLRGEHGKANQGHGGKSGSSPLTRGARALLKQLDLLDRLIPAYAGSTIQCTRTCAVHPAHPRLRGEHELQEPWYLPVQGSSPLTRGARRPRR